MPRPVILIHGGNFTSGCWSGVQAALSCPSLAIDLPGRGRHPADLSRIRLKDFADSVVAELDAAGIDRALCVGHSLGGATLCLLALQYPTRVAALAFVASPVPSHGGCVADACDRPAQAALSAARTQGLSVIPPPEARFARQIFGNDMDAATFEDMSRSTSAESLGVFFEPIDLTGLRRGIPTLYVKLLRDTASPPAVQDRAIAAVLPTKVATIDSGHMAMYTRPAELAAALADWALE
jgi:pimeloyl-ACP methyl ester carboxylesterase